jgi:acetyl-CoA decarbonylase/synthase complex subunit gamma
MAVKGSDLKSLLPEDGKKNCKECGLPTCFAFAMKLAKGGVTPSQCPHLSAEAAGRIEAALTPPMALVRIGAGDQAFEVGREEVMYRHEKTFFRPPGVAIMISDVDSEAAVDRKLGLVEEAVFERAQVTLTPELLALRFDSGDPGRYRALVEKAYAASPRSAMLWAEDLDALFTARDIYWDRRPIVYPITAAGLEAALPAILDRPTPIGLRAPGWQRLASLAEKCLAAGLDQLLLDSSPRSLEEAIEHQTLIRRAALLHGITALGFPTLGLPGAWTQDPLEEVLLAGALVAKYAGVIAVSRAEPEYLFPLLVARMDIYTDPRRLRTVEARLYRINDPGDGAPVLVTTNFALTFFSVSSEAEASKVPAYLAILDSGGLGVEAAMAAGKFSGPTIARFLKESGLEDRLRSRRLILPYLASRLSSELSEELPDWEVHIGPKAVNQLPAYLRGQAGSWGMSA